MSYFTAFDVVSFPVAECVIETAVVFIGVVLALCASITVFMCRTKQGRPTVSNLGDSLSGWLAVAAASPGVFLAIMACLCAMAGSGRQALDTASVPAAGDLVSLGSNNPPMDDPPPRLAPTAETQSRRRIIVVRVSVADGCGKVTDKVWMPLLIEKGPYEVDEMYPSLSPGDMAIGNL